MIDVKRCMAHAWRQNEQTVFCCSHPWSFYKVSSLKEWKGNLFCKSFMWHKLPPHWHGTWSEIPQGFQKRSRDIPSLPEWIKKAAKQSKPETLHIIIKIYVCLRRKTEYFRFHCTISLPNQFELLVSGRPGWNSILVENFINHYVTESLFTKVDLSSLHVLHYTNSAWYVVLILALSVVMRIQE